MNTEPGTASQGAASDSQPSGGLINWKIVGIAILLIAAYYAYTYFRPHPLEGKPAPPFSLALLDGGVFDLAEHLGERPVLLDFWAVWCPPCREGLPKLDDAVKAFDNTDVVVCAVNLGEAPETVRSFLSGRDIDIPVALDLGGEAAEIYQVSSIPMLVFIDRSGIIRHVSVGLMQPSALKRRLEAIL